MHDTKRRLRERGFKNPVLLLHPLGLRLFIQFAFNAELEIRSVSSVHSSSYDRTHYYLSLLLQHSMGQMIKPPASVGLSVTSPMVLNGRRTHSISMKLHRSLELEKEDRLTRGVD